ncbi:hypothetical protein [Winogradskyella luteola]|uniref:Uncharacterized protein n=1 Tax=Winogradskyella luteola TaxID=2828330 RepID=A0A9X1JME7_9FLAO|nr:hypothetical protein [Winogradskyella luteola]MBV7268375.1 hypothetical protein [Winogradskyella luteola]
MTWRNTAENLGISIVAFLAGAFVCYKVMDKTVDTTTKRILEANNEVIMEAIRKETTSITNEFKTEIKKLKNRKGEVTLDVKPVIDNQIKQQEQNGDTLTVVPEEKKEDRPGFFKRLFGKKNKNKKKNDE